MKMDSHSVIMSRGNVLVDLALKGQTDHIYCRQNQRQIRSNSMLNPTLEEAQDCFLKKTIEAETRELKDCSTNPPACTLNTTGTELEEAPDCFLEKTTEAKTPSLEDLSTNSTECMLNPTGTASEKATEAFGPEDCFTNLPECTFNPTGTALEKTSEAEISGLENITIEFIGCEENDLQAISEVDKINMHFFNVADLFDVENIENEIEIVNNVETIQTQNNDLDETIERDMETIQIQNSIVDNAMECDIDYDPVDKSDTSDSDKEPGIPTIADNAMESDVDYDPVDESDTSDSDKEPGIPTIADDNAMESDVDYNPVDKSNTSDYDQEPGIPTIADNENEVNQSEVSQKRSQRGRAQRKEWEQYKNKIKRLKGEEYFGRRKNEEGKNVFDVKKAKKKIKPRCQCRAITKTAFKCNTISEEDRRNIFAKFWSLNWGERKFFVQSLIDSRSVTQRRVVDTDMPRRNKSLFYHLTIHDKPEKVRVCKKMFMNTLSVGEWTILNWMATDNNVQDQGDDENEDEVMERHQNSINTRKSKSDKAKKDLVKLFFASLPKLESHYCRKDSKKLYLEPKWKSKAELYRLYESFCKSQDKETLTSSICFFHEIFDESNLGLFQPKKDQCDTCCSFKMENLSEENYRAHIDLKEKARKEKETDKSNSACPDSKTAVFTMDLQAVLLSPDLNASALYYRTKLKVHNFTIFNINNSDGYCYLWDESEGGLNADEFASIIYNFVTTEVDRVAYNHVILYSDGCTYQNRNCILSNALLLAAQQTGITITQKYLEKGHTQMECDSMHATIERKLKNREIYSPSGYEEACRTARLHPQPYKVQYIYHDFFKKYSDLKFFQSIRPGSRTGDPVVTDIRSIEYKPDWLLQVKLKFADTFIELPRRVKKPRVEVVVRLLYQSRIPVEANKFKHLQEMKSVLPRDVHSYYDTLPHKQQYENKLCNSSQCFCIIGI